MSGYFKLTKVDRIIKRNIKDYEGSPVQAVEPNGFISSFLGGRYMKTINAVHVHRLDNCVTLTDFAEAGDTVRFFEDGVEKVVTARESIPKWHKMAVTSIEKGGSVFKYGAVIGFTLSFVEAGDCLHIHNIRSSGIGG